MFLKPVKYQGVCTNKQLLEAATKLICIIHLKSFLFKLNNVLLLKYMYEGHLESKERSAIQRYLLIIGKKKNMQVL